MAMTDDEIYHSVARSITETPMPLADVVSLLRELDHSGYERGWMDACAEMRERLDRRVA